MISKCDTKLYELIRENIKTMPHNELFYALLDWADQHQDIRKQLAKEKDEYYVRYILKNGKEYCKSFRIDNCCNHNPYIEARLFYGNVKKDSICCEMWHKPNPYIMGPERNGRLIISYDAEGDK